jgi:hypothetical protein
MAAMSADMPIGQQPARRGPPLPSAGPSRYSAGAMRMAYMVGARPNFVTMAPFIAEPRRWLKANIAALRPKWNFVSAPSAAMS